MGANYYGNFLEHYELKGVKVVNTYLSDMYRFYSWINTHLFSE